MKYRIEELGKEYMLYLTSRNYGEHREEIIGLADEQETMQYLAALKPGETLEVRFDGYDDL